MCIKCVYSMLDQLRWELVVQEHELQGQKPNQEIIDTVKGQAKTNGGLILPRIALQRSPGMSDQQYNEAKQIFKDCMLNNRRMQISALEAVANLLENEVFQPHPIISIDAGTVLNGGESNAGS